MTNTAGYYVTFTITAQNANGDTKKFEKFKVVKYANITEFEQNQHDNFKEIPIHEYLNLPWVYVVDITVDNCSDHPPTDKYIDMKKYEDMKTQAKHLMNITNISKYEMNIRNCAIITVCTCFIATPVTVPLIIYYKIKMIKAKRNFSV